jgi:hypothetical protein
LRAQRYISAVDGPLNHKGGNGHRFGNRVRRAASRSSRSRPIWDTMRAEVAGGHVRADPAEQRSAMSSRSVNGRARRDRVLPCPAASVELILPGGSRAVHAIDPLARLVIWASVVSADQRG